MWICFGIFRTNFQGSGTLKRWGPDWLGGHVIRP
jgi:hypothetical protein